MREIYFDNAATTRVTKPVLDVALPFLTEDYGNPSSVHSMGRIAKDAINLARVTCAKAINAKPEQIFFTSGATESNNIVCREFEYVLKSPYEHPSVAGVSWDDFNTSLNKMERYGVTRGLVCCQTANSEIGSVFNVRSYADRTHNAGYKFMTDATQAFSHMRIDVKAMNCDFLSLSAGKFHGFKGTGLLYIKDPDEFIKSATHLNVGGSQENGLRSGTENVAGIVAMGKAMTLYNYDPIVSEMHYRLKQTLITGLAKRCPVEFRVNEIKGLKTLNNICNISFKGINGESLARLLDYDGFIVSTKSACKSGSSEPSKVLKAIDTPDDYLFGAIRISFSEETDTGVVGMLVNAICEKISVLIKINDWRNER